MKEKKIIEEALKRMKVSEEESTEEVNIWIDVMRENALEEYLSLGGSVFEVMKATNVELCRHCPAFQKMMINHIEGEE